MRMNFKSASVVIGMLCVLLLLVAVVTIVVTANDGWTYGRDNLLPELFGFCLDGILFVGLLGYVQERSERRRLDRLHRTLLEQLAEVAAAIRSSLLSSKLNVLDPTFPHTPLRVLPSFYSE
jgi:uncharacterized integral membrane protein